MHRRFFLQAAAGTLAAFPTTLVSADAVMMVNNSNGPGSAETLDFLHSRTVLVDGWMLAESEAAAYVRGRQAR